MISIEQWQTFAMYWLAFVAAVYIYAASDFYYYRLHIKTKLKKFKDIMTEE